MPGLVLLTLRRAKLRPYSLVECNKSAYLEMETKLSASMPSIFLSFSRSSLLNMPRVFVFSVNSLWTSRSRHLLAHHGFGIFGHEHNEIIASSAVVCSSIKLLTPELMAVFRIIVKLPTKIARTVKMVRTLLRKRLWFAVRMVSKICISFLFFRF